MIEYDFPQGSPAWHRHRVAAYNASEAAAAMGCSPYMTRDQLLYCLHTGTRPEPTPEQERLYAAGHAAEDMARPVVEAWLGRSLFPVVGSLPVGSYGLEERPLSASFDGLVATQTIAWECKLLNADLRNALRVSGWEGRHENDARALPLFYRVQLEQQMLVSETVERTLFTAVEFQGKVMKDVRACWYTSDPELREQLIRAWQLVEAELKVYVVPELPPPAPVGNKVAGTLPALVMDVRGEVLASNLQEWELAAIEKVESIIDPQALVSDQDFADAKEAVKWCEDAEAELARAKKLALAKMKSIDELFAAIDRVMGTLTTKRITLDKAVKMRREQRVREIIAKGVTALNNHLAALEQRLQGLLPEGTKIAGALMPLIPSNFQDAVKNKRNFASMESAVNDEVARCKVLANQAYEVRERNLRLLQAKAAEHRHLFADWKELIAKDSEVVELQIDHRIRQETERLEAEAQRRREAEEAAAAAAAEAELRRQREAEVEAGLDRSGRDRDHRGPRCAVAPGQSLQDDDPLAPADKVPPQIQQEPVTGPGYVAPAGVGPAANEPAVSHCGPPTMKVGDISARLGFVVTKEFLKRLGHAPAEEVGTRILYHEAAFPAICTSIARHTTAVGQQYLKEAA